jgi:hypothetical protein
MDAGCDQPRTAAVTVTQTGCTFQFTLPSLATISGELRSPPGPGTVQFLAGTPGSGPGCQNPLTALIEFQAENRVFITFGTTGPPCCQHTLATLTR